MNDSRVGCFVPWTSDGMISIYFGGWIFGICSFTFVLHLLLSFRCLQFPVTGYILLIALYVFLTTCIFNPLLPFQLSLLKFCLIIATCMSIFFLKSCSFVLTRPVKHYPGDVSSLSLLNKCSCTSKTEDLEAATHRCS